APSNIGPYSQSRESGGSLYIAGQIGLNPSTMVLTEGSLIQSVLSLQFAMKIARARNCQTVGGLIAFIGDKLDEEKAWATWRASREDLLAEFCYCGNMLVVGVDDLPRHAAIEWYMVGAKCRSNSLSIPSNETPIKVSKSSNDSGYLNIIVVNFSGFRTM